MLGIGDVEDWASNGIEFGKQARFKKVGLLKNRLCCEKMGMVWKKWLWI